MLNPTFVKGKQLPQNLILVKLVPEGAGVVRSRDVRNLYFLCHFHTGFPESSVMDL